MRRSFSTIVAVGVLVSGLGVTFTGATPNARPHACQEEDGGTNDVYVGRLDARDLAAVRATGLDMHEMDLSAARDGQGRRRGRAQRAIRRPSSSEQGVDLEPKQIDGQTAAERSTRDARRRATNVFRRYSGAGGHQGRVRADRRRHTPTSPSWSRSARPSTARTSSPSRSPRTRRQTARRQAPGHPVLGGPARPRVDHARDGPAADPLRRRRLRHEPARSRDLVEQDRAVVRARRQPRRLRLHVRARPAPVAQEPARQRRRRRDRPPATASTPTATTRPSGATTTRAPRPNRRARPTAAPAPASEPETQALDGLMDRVGFEFLINYHSAAELLLYGTGWQVATPTPGRRDLRGDGRRRRHTRPSRATTPTSRPSSTPPTARRPSTPQRPTARSASRPRCRRARPPAESIPTTSGTRPTARAASTSPTTRRWSRPSSRRTCRSPSPRPSRSLDPDDPVSVVGRDTPDFVRRQLRRVLRRPAARRRHRQARPRATGG